MIRGMSAIDNYLRRIGCPDVEKNMSKVPYRVSPRTGVAEASETELTAFVAALKAPAREPERQTREAKDTTSRPAARRRTRRKKGSE